MPYKSVFSLVAIIALTIGISADDLKKNYSFNSPLIQNDAITGAGYDHIRSDFAPNTLVKYASLLLPTGHTAKSVSVEYGSPESLRNKSYLRPYYPGGRLSVKPPENRFLNRSSVYEKNEFYPPIERSSTTDFRVMYKNGHAIVTVMMTPVQYNPITNEIRYHPNVSLTINTEPNRDAPVYKCNNFIRSRLKELVDNPEVVNSLPNSVIGENDYEYLIITNNNLKDKWGDFVSFNTRRCLRTKIVSISDISRKYRNINRDNQTKIRSFIKEEYEKYNIVFVMLGGDVEIVPVRGMYTSFFDYGVEPIEDYNIAADLYYSCLDGTWQKSGSKYYGEYGCEDVGWEVYASRFSIDSENELKNMINKTIKYSEKPVKNSVTNVILSGEDLWNKYKWNSQTKKYEKTDKICYGDENMEELIGKCTNNGYTTEGWSSSTNFTKLYRAQTNWTGSTLINTIRDKKISFVDHLGHSNINYILKLYTQDVSTSNFLNDGTTANFFIVYTQGCYPGSFDNINTNGSSQSADCIAEKFTTMSTAAVAMVSNTRYGLGADGREGSTGNSIYTDGSSSRYQRFFHAGLSKNLPLEMANGWGKEQNKDWICNSDPNGKPYHGQMKYCAYEVNVLGDPALHVWTGEVKEMEASYTSPLASNTFSWETKIPGTWVALADENGKIISFQIADDEGKVSIKDDVFKNYLKNNSGKNLKVFAKAQNHLAFEGELPVNVTSIQNNTKLCALKTNITLASKTLSVSFTSPSIGRYSVELNNAKGIRVFNTKNTVNTIGVQTITIKTDQLSSGIYYCTLFANNKKAISRFVICK